MRDGRSSATPRPLDGSSSPTPARGAAAARACVAHPQEGTILTVADAGAAAAVEAAEAGGSLADVCEAAVDAAREALARTPDQLEALRQRRGGRRRRRGVVLLLESLDGSSPVTAASDEGLLSAGPGSSGATSGVRPAPDAQRVPGQRAGPRRHLPGHDPLDVAGERLGRAGLRGHVPPRDATPEAVDRCGDA